MSKLRKVIASRLKAAQNNAAMLTTFNEIDMTALMALRSDYRQDFETTHGIRLGFMGMFVLAAVQALREFPAVNAEIDGGDIIYKNYYNIGVAVGTPQGLVVPVVRDAGDMGLADIETTIGDFGARARNGKITPDEMAGGTFTISNGGVYGSLMSTPILNPPQSGILGMHKIPQACLGTGAPPEPESTDVPGKPPIQLELANHHDVQSSRWLTAALHSPATEARRFSVLEVRCQRNGPRVVC